MILDDDDNNNNNKSTRVWQQTVAALCDRVTFGAVDGVLSTGRITLRYNNITTTAATTGAAAAAGRTNVHDDCAR